jgi:peptide/nickel transport system permease protein
MAREIAVPLELEEERSMRPARWRRLLRTARHHPLGVFGLLCIGLLFFCGIFADLIVPFNPETKTVRTQTLGELTAAIGEGDVYIVARGSALDKGTTITLGEELTFVIDLAELPTGGAIVEVERATDVPSGPPLFPGASVCESKTGSGLPCPASGVLGTLSFRLGTDDSSLVVADSKVEDGSTIFLNAEKMTVKSVQPANPGDAVLQMDRGTGGTEAAEHEGGAPIVETAVDTLSSPSWRHPFGTDNLGRDVLSRVIFGARVSLLIGLVAVISGVSAGAFFGVLSGYFGRLIDSLIQRSVDILLSFPAVVLLLAIITVVGDDESSVRKFLAKNTPVPEGEFLNIPNFLDVFIIALAIGLAIATFTARVTRGSVLSIKENVYIDAARAMGASNVRIMARHILPNVLALIVVLASVLLPIAILSEAAISFLGVGVPIPTPSWGADLSGTNRDLALDGFWWPAFFPGLALSLVVLGFNMMGDTFRDISDPRLRGSGLGGGGGGGGGAGRGGI